MRKHIFLLAALLGLATSSLKADVLIYRVAETSRTIGYDRLVGSTAGGYLVIDWESGDVRMLRASVVNGVRQFTISNPRGIRIYVANGPSGSTYTVMTRYEEKGSPYTEILDVMYGIDQVLNIRPNRPVYSPRIFVGSPKSVTVPGSDDDVILTTSSVTATYQGVQTQQANAADQTADGVMERYRALYLAKGYYEVADTQ